MKRIWLTLVVAMMLVAVSCVAQADYLGILRSLEEWSPSVWGFELNDKDYIPQKGGIKVCKEENVVIVGFYLSDKNIEFYSRKFPDGRRKPLGFEFVIKDRSRVFDRNDMTGVKLSFPSTSWYSENYLEDDDDIYTLAIKNPEQLSPGVWYTVELQFSKHATVDQATFEVQVQLVGDMRKLRDDHHDIYNGYGVDVEAAMAIWFTVGGGQEDLDGNNYFNIRSPEGSMFYQDQFFVNYDRFLWDMIKGERWDFEPGYCGFGDDPWEDPESTPVPERQTSQPGTSQYGTPVYSEVDNDGDSSVDTSADNISIREVKASIANKGSYGKELTLYTDELYDAKGYVKNKGSHGVRVDYRFFYDDDKTFNFNKNTHHYLGSNKEVYIGDGKIVSSTQHDCKAPSEPGRYYVYLKAKCDDDTDYSSRDVREQFVILNVKARPVIAKFSAIPTFGIAPLNVSFSDASTGPVQSRNWNFGDGSVSSELNPFHLYDIPGTYTVILTVTNYDCVSSTQLTVSVESQPLPKYLFSWATTAQGIQEEGDYFYSPIVPRVTFNQGEAMYYLAKLESVTAPHRLKLEIQHSDGWGWEEVWNWEDPGAGWDYTFFNTNIENPDPGIWTFTLYISLDDQSWTQLSAIQAQVLANGPIYQYVNTQACEGLTYYDDPLWVYERSNVKDTFHVGEDIYVIAEITDVTVDHRFKIEVYYNGEFWWSQGGEGEIFEEVSGVWDHSYSYLIQNAELEGVFTFKTYLETSEGSQFLQQLDVNVIP